MLWGKSPGIEGLPELSRRVGIGRPGCWRTSGKGEACVSPSMPPCSRRIGDYRSHWHPVARDEAVLLEVGLIGRHRVAGLALRPGQMAMMAVATRRARLSRPMSRT